MWIAFPRSGGITPPSIATSLPYNGDPTGLRALMAAYGVTFNFLYINDVLGNVNGGLRRGFIDQGLLDYNMTVDFEKLIGWQGLSFHTNAFLIHNTGRILRDYVGGINTIAAIEATPTGRLSELWLEQSFWNGGASLRAGQLAADVEFFYADAALMFLQTDWPTIIAADLPSGGPAYPLSTPGARVKVDPNEHISVLAAVFGKISPAVAHLPNAPIRKTRTRMPRRRRSCAHAPARALRTPVPRAPDMCRTARNRRPPPNGPWPRQ